MNGTTTVGDVSLGTVPVEWSIAATADFNSDRQTDILWQNTVTGERYIWFMNGSAHRRWGQPRYRARGVVHRHRGRLQR